jgi:hypothetical protein
MKRIAMFLVMFALLIGITIPSCNGGSTGTGNGNGSTPPPSSASFSVSNLSIEPAEIAPNEMVTVSVSVANTGGTQGTHNVVFNVDGAQEATESVTLSPSGSETITFDVSRGDVGTYAVSIGNLSGSFDVMPIDWLLQAADLAQANISSYQFEMYMEMTNSTETPETTIIEASAAIDEADNGMYFEMQTTTVPPTDFGQTRTATYLVGEWVYSFSYYPGMPPEATGTWFKTPVTEDLQHSLLLQQEFITTSDDSLLEIIPSLELIGTEVVEGIECYKLQFSLSEEDMIDTFPPDPTLDPEEYTNEFIGTLWIAKNTHFIMKMNWEVSMASEDQYYNMTVSYLTYNINEPITIELPPGAETAEEMPAF